jgi:serine/threonine-protein phosphatase 5
MRVITRPPTPIFSNEIFAPKAKDKTKIELSKLYNERARVHLKNKQYSLANEDARIALELDPDNRLAVFTQHEAHKLSYDTSALYRDFLFFPFLKELHPIEFKEIAEFHVKIGKFAEKVHNITVKLSSEPVSGEYNFNKFTRENALELMETLRNFKLPSLETVENLIDKIKSMHESLKNIVYIDAPKAPIKIKIVGDTHGQFQDLLYIFSQYGYPAPDNPYIFNGDYVDRGSMGVEILIALFAWKVAVPNSIFLNRGNHETIAMNRLYGFEKECVIKYNQNVFSKFSDVFCFLPVGHVIGNKVLVVHGGLFGDTTVTLSNIQNFNRVGQPPEYGPMNDILWSDPMDQYGHAPSPRGVTKTFGPDITEAFLKREGLDLLIRSHQMQMEGYLVQHNGKCITVFSAPNYVGRMGNKGAIVFLTFDENGQLKQPEFASFVAQPIPKDFRPMQYSTFSAYF